MVRSFTPHPTLSALLICFVLVTTALSTLVPLGEAADEISHQSYVRYVAEYGGLPPVIEGTSVYGETFQPPLYYTLAAPLTAWLPRGPEENLAFALPVTDNPDWELGNPTRARLLLQPAAARWPWQGEALGWHLVRFFSVALGVVTILATYRLGRLTWPTERWTACLAAAFVAFLPSFVAISAAVTNDTLATTLSALLLAQVATVLKSTDAITTPFLKKGGGKEAGGGERENTLRPASADLIRDRRWILVGILGGVGVWAKAGGWLLLGIVGLALLVQTHRTRTLRPWLFAGLSWFVVVLPLWVLNLQRSGDIMGQGIQRTVTDGRTDFSLTAWGDALASLLRTWWAGFGGAVHLSFPQGVNLLLFIPLALAGVGLAHSYRKGAVPRLLVSLLLIHVGLTFIAWGAWTMLVLGTGQGRLLFPALPAIAVLVAGGWRRLFPGRRGIVTLAGGMALLLLSAVAFILWPAYRTLPSAPPRPATATVEQWHVSDLPLALEAFHFAWTIDDRITPGDAAPFYVAWQSTAPLPDVRLRLRWIEREGNGIATKEGSPIATHPLTDEWQPGEYAALHRVRLPDNITGGYYRLMLSVIDPRTGVPYPLRGPGGAEVEELMVGQTTVIAP